jgi:Lipase (class 3)
VNLNAKQFDLGNAQTCAQASVLAYGRIALPANGTDIDVTFTDTHCTVLENADCVIIAFRGTDSIRDWITDAEFLRTQFSQRTGEDMAEVHSGFLRAFDSILPPLTDHLNKIVLGTRPVFVTGHSLGGGLALLAALELQRRGANVAQVYTFGQPRVGNAAFGKLYGALAERTFRLVYQEDIVPRVPHLPKLHDPYRHCGQEVFISSTTPVRAVDDLWFNPPLWRLLISDAWGIYRAWLVSKFRGALDPIQDHFIINYTRALENITP